MEWKHKLLPFRDRIKTKREPLPSTVPIQITDSSPGLPLDDGGTSHAEKPDSSTPVVLKLVRERSAKRKLDPLGLNLLYTPEGPPSIDIIFIHGLGGTSQTTWSYNRDASLFWPKMWLPQEPDTCTARILTFGYNAHFLSTGPKNISGISDFAKSLLFDLKFGKDSGGEDLGIGERPIIFVVHSMGGLVFKKAYIQGSNNDEYKAIISQVRSVVFLSTPHRGTDLADTLNRILTVSIFNHTPKQYISELKQNSPMIEDINEEFPNHAEKLQIFSFYETLETQIGPSKLMVLRGGSATLGYKGELRVPLDADHHHVCKFASRNDPNYKRVLSVLKSLVSSYREEDSKVHNFKLGKEMQRISSILRTTSAPEDDYTSLLDRWSPGTCQKILSHPDVIEWQNSSTGSKILWMHGQPGSGKSINTAVQIRHMKERDIYCSYYFFRYGDVTKRSPGSLFKSLAFQIAQNFPAFRKALIVLNENGIEVERMDARMIWEKLFVGTLFKLDLGLPLYFMIDALDESDSANSIIGLLSGISISRTPVKIFVSSRKTPDICMAFERISPKISVMSVSATENLDDIRLYATAEMKYMHGSPELGQEIIDSIVEGAEGNFLWAHLTLKQIMQCHSPDGIKQVLSDMPPGMEAIYKRMESSIACLSRPSDLRLARMILAWVTYSRRPLDAEELIRALQPAIPSIIDVQFTVNQLCGNFAVVDCSNRVTLVHQTAREYLVKQAQLPFSMAAQDTHEELFCKTLGVFLDSQIRSKLAKRPMPPFYEYAATSWAYHLGHCSPSDTSLTLLVEFLESTSVLHWIRLLATLGKLKVLILSSNTLHSFVERKQRFHNTTKSPHNRPTNLELLRLWAIDLLKLVGKFGRHLIQDPAAIQEYIPQICPRQSAVFKQFAQQARLSIKGISNDYWDDCLTRVSVNGMHQVRQIVSSARYIGVFTSGKIIVLWDSTTFEEVRSLSHDEHIFAICFTDKGDVIASYGYHTTKFWKVDTGCLIRTVVNQLNSRALCICFYKDDTKLLVGLTSGKVAELSLEDDSLGWCMINPSFLEENTLIAGAYLNPPTSVAFNADRVYIAMAYRGSPLTVWDITEKNLIGRCRRKSEREFGLDESWSGVNRVVWHPHKEEVLGIYTDGIVFKWNPFEEIHEELQAGPYVSPSEIHCSPNGLFFATSDVHGVVRLYNYHSFSLVYQLNSEDMITGLCFSLDSKRFYDLRGPYCNVWEPDVLFGLPDMSDERDRDGKGEMNLDILHHHSEMWAEMPTSVSALSMSLSSCLFASGNDDGLLKFHDLSRSSNPIQVGNSGFDMGIDFITWAEKASYLAYSNSEKVIVSKVLERESNSNTLTRDLEITMNIDLDFEVGTLQQILLHPEARYILISCSNATQIWSSDTKSLYKTFPTNCRTVWANHPLDGGQVLSFSSELATTHSWDSLDVIAQWTINLSPDLDPSTKGSHDYKCQPAPQSASSTLLEANNEIKEYIDEVIISQDREYALILTSKQVRFSTRRWSSLMVLQVAHFQDTQIGNLNPVSIPQHIMACMERPLGVLGKDRLVFLDRDFWICTWPLRSARGPSSLARHFFLPRDWVRPKTLHLCCVMRDGTFLCPVKEQVAVIKSSLTRDW